MRKIIVVAGATGNLGGKIIKALLTKDVRSASNCPFKTDKKKLRPRTKGVKVFQVDTNNKSEISKHCIEHIVSYQLWQV
jgi:uncharacterized protein YbjT (DUF2867 family)